MYTLRMSCHGTFYVTITESIFGYSALQDALQRHPSPEGQPFLKAPTQTKHIIFKSNPNCMAETANQYIGISFPECIETTPR